MEVFRKILIVAFSSTLLLYMLVLNFTCMGHAKINFYFYFFLFSHETVNDMTELDSDGEESGSEIETEGEDDNDNDSTIIDEGEFLSNFCFVY